ncbi:right-handed parallel beta-helix repeat-containing protein, partial [Rubripirellula amarantea]|nr:right-handed parallel beta-helix repeat-containing protein [Rubripirellula amarantea]
MLAGDAINLPTDANSLASSFRDVYLNQFGNASFVETIDTGDQKRGYSFSSNEDRLGLQVQAFAISGDLDLEIADYDGPGGITGIQFDSDDNTSGLDPQLGAASTGQLSLWFLVGERQEDNTGSFQLNVIGDESFTSSAITFSGETASASGNVSKAEDFDFISFVAPESGNYEIEVLPDATLDATFNVYNQFGQPVVGNYLVPVNDGATGSPERTVVNLFAGAEYFVRVDGLGADAGDFDLNVQSLTLDVTTLEDVVDSGDGVLSLREAINIANSVPAASRIVLGEGTHTLTLTGADDSNATGDLDLRNDISIVGAGSELTTIDAGGATGINDRVFDTVTGDFDIAIAGLSIRGGVAGDDGAGILHRGSGTLVLDDVSMEDNTAGNGGGGLFVANGATAEVTDSKFLSNQAAFGGGIFNEGTVTVNRSRLSGNTGTSLGGGIETERAARTNVYGSTIDNNTAYAGGGISTFNATTTIVNSTISGNSSDVQGGAVLNIVDNTGSTSRTLIVQSTIAGNSSDQAGVVHSGGQNGADPNSGIIEIANSIVVDSVAPAGNFSFDSAVITSLGNNLSSDDANSVLDAVGDLIDVTDPVIELSLSTRGGGLPTHALVDGGPA